MSKLLETLPKLIKLKQIELDSSLNAFNDKIRILTDKQNQLKELKSYYDEYIESTNTDGSNTIHVSILSKQRNFFNHLQEVILIQKKVCSDLTKQVDIARAQLTILFTKIKSYEKTLDILHKHKLKETQYLQQKISDEIANFVQNYQK